MCAVLYIAIQCCDVCGVYCSILHDVLHDSVRADKGATVRAVLEDWRTC